MLLPQSLWALVTLLWLSVPSVRAQTTPVSLSFNTPVTLTGRNFSTTSTPLLFSLPSPSSPEVTVSLALVFVSNSSSAQVVPGPTGGADVYEVILSGLGLGNFTFELQTGITGVLAVYGGSAADSLEIGVSQGTTPLHAPLADVPFFGDSTANEALLFSPPFLPPTPAPQPTYPNYTLPLANTSLPSPPATQNTPNFTLFLAPLSARLTALPQTACAVRAGVTNDPRAARSAQVLAEQLWLRDSQGWRREWLVGQLTPLTNYSVYAIQDGTRLSGPLYFTTKSGDVVLVPTRTRVALLPDHGYAVPLPVPPARALVYDATNLPDSLATPLLGYLTNFTTSLLTTACDCAGCQTAYRHWLCSISFPRCGEFPQTESTSKQGEQEQPLTVPLPALVSQPSGMTPRNAALGNVSDYTALLPCLETCQAVDRACPIFLGFRCPLPDFTASASYGVGYIDSADGDVQGGGIPGVAQDQWGNVLCNAS
ncbi:stretch-activated Ca2+-permeable channel component-domain-containing protein [Multifurca ochricompacta]|uniref:Stretch-activated Ca2+-permeable channel component-domain-containing protein n=1 Tax=Multifurca ochricompacta TaxID=376703 RepID=A0AAD4M575_9AGAM|nr:stretch-activated Ca2+-permeable channel component-domain-containing protein [Multifurca ochricompacta]